MKTRRTRGFTILLIILTAALVCLAVFFITGMFDIFGAAKPGDLTSQKTGTLGGEPLSVTWTVGADGLAHFTVNIPPDVTDIENIEWIQRDDMGGGMEQMLYHDGPDERTLSIAPLDEGKTTITTVVTTTSGESASAETVVDWPLANQ